MSLATKITFAVAVFGITSFTVNWTNGNNISRKITNIPQLVEYDQLGKELSGERFADVLELSREKPSEWAQFQKKCEEYSGMRTNETVISALRLRENYMRQFNHSSNYVALSIGATLLGILGYLESRENERLKNQARK